ncbi:FecR family protein [Sphingobacterium multivorum]|uniref:FecR family protein n=1 Tax=Sphingobacterium multivorum TaxID=28454 RepID=UPI00289B0130|nr:FecR domain-containing protein [Sphingobacterium multivorum]
MMDHQFILVDFLVKHFSGTLSQADTQALQKIFEDDPTLHERWERYTSQGLRSSDAEFWNNLDLDRARTKILNYTSAELAKRPLHTGGMRQLKIYAGLAASLLIFLGVAWFLNSAPQDKQIVADQVYRYNNDVLPGGQKATLTLSNGKTVALSDEKTTIEETHGEQLQIVDGQLQYKPNSGQAELANLKNTLKVPESGFYRMVLPDGTKVWINSASELSYPLAFGKSTRNVELRGEAYFEVAHEKNRPFIVSTIHGAVKVLGTTFNLTAYSNAASNVTLINGSIQLTNKNKMTKQIVPGQKVEFDGNDMRVSQANIEKETAWQHGYFYFEHDQIQDIMEQLARWYDIQVIYKGPISKKKFGGSMSRSVSLAEALELIKRGAGLEFEIDRKTVTVKNKS